MMRRPIVVGLVLLAAEVLDGTMAFGQIAPLPHRAVEVDIDSGRVLNMAIARGVVYSTTIQVRDATWLRLTFDEATLARTPAGGHSTVLRITSLADGGTQHHTTQTLEQWSHTSAYFNGDAVRLEVIADPAARASRVRITQVMVGVPGGDPLATICGPTDDRLPSDDPRSGRALPVGCTAWIFDDANNCLLTAGHCSTTSLQVIEFNVPLSDGGGNIQHPGPEDQYTVDVSSKQSVNGGIGNDWGYFGCFPNSETGLTPGEAQGAFFTLADTPPPVQGQDIRITGYGVDSSPPQWNLIQQTHAGPYITFSGTTVQYQTDTRGGSSGSPVIDDETGLGIGIHTNGGCDGGGGGTNKGTGSNNTGLQNALADPQGVCASLPPLSFNFPDGLPELLNPAGDTIRVEVFGQNGGEPQPGTGKLHYDLGDGFIEIDMLEVVPNIYDALFPPIPCTMPVNFFFSAQTTRGEEITNPSLAPDAHYNALSGLGFDVSFADDFEADLGWTVAGNAPTGQWERGVPVNCVRGDPPTDADGSGNCYLTENDPADCNSDVDNGNTILTSPIMDATAGSSLIGYFRWFSNTFGGNPMQDIFVIELSDDGGASWVALETVGPTGPDVSGGWVEKQFFIGDFVELTDQFRIRFIASDTDPQSVVEAAIDGLRLFSIICDEAIPGDLDGDGSVGVKDLLILLGNWGPCADCKACSADIDGDCTVGAKDLLILLGNWG